jgi:large subunit ribosomal protein L23
MATSHEILVRPIITEKNTLLNDKGKYTFEVLPNANKIEIKHAVERIFGVKVTRVNTLNRQGKRKRNRRTGDWGQRSAQKRAVVALAEGDQIEIFGGT